MPRRRRRRSRWRRHRLARRALVAALLLIGSATLLDEVATGRATRQDAIAAAVATRDLPSGSVLAADDVESTTLAHDSPLSRVALPAEAVVGRSTIGDLGAGEMITGTRLLRDEAAPTGYTRMPVAFPDDQISSYLSPGMHIDIVWTPDGFAGEPPQVVATDVRVVRIMQSEASAARSSGSVSVLVDVAQQDAVSLAATTQSGALSVLLR